MMQVLTLDFAKLSFVFFFRRPFAATTDSKFGFACIGMIVVIALWTVAFFLHFSLLAGPIFQPGGQAPVKSPGRNALGWTSNMALHYRTLSWMSWPWSCLFQLWAGILLFNVLTPVLGLY